MACSVVHMTAGGESWYCSMLTLSKELRKILHKRMQIYSPHKRCIDWRQVKDQLEWSFMVVTSQRELGKWKDWCRSQTKMTRGYFQGSNFRPNMSCLLITASTVFLLPRSFRSEAQMMATWKEHSWCNAIRLWGHSDQCSRKWRNHRMAARQNPSGCKTQAKCRTVLNRGMQDTI